MREHIRQRRLSLGLFPKELADLAGVSDQTISNIETKPDKTVSTELVVKVWRALDDYEAAGNRPASPVSDDAAALQEVLGIMSKVAGLLGVTLEVDSTLPPVEQLSASAAVVEKAIVDRVRPRRPARRAEEQPSGSLDPAIAEQRQRAAVSRTHPSK